MGTTDVAERNRSLVVIIFIKLFKNQIVYVTNEYLIFGWECGN